MSLYYKRVLYMLGFMILTFGFLIGVIATVAIL